MHLGVLGPTRKSSWPHFFPWFGQGRAEGSTNPGCTDIRFRCNSLQTCYLTTRTRIVIRCCCNQNQWPAACSLGRPHPHGFRQPTQSPWTASAGARDLNRTLLRRFNSAITVSQTDGCFVVLRIERTVLVIWIISERIPSRRRPGIATDSRKGQNSNLWDRQIVSVAP